MPKKLKQFVITKTVSGRKWGSIDKKELFARLKTGLDEGVAGATEAIQEVYAVVKASIGAELTQADCLAPHHDVSATGRTVLNRAGLAAATAALAGARSKPDLTDSQKEAARQHLLRHYEELEQEPPVSLTEPEGEMGKAQGEMTAVTARICGEMAVSEIPVSPAVDIEALKEDDDDSLELVVEIPAGKSKRGWNYLPRSLQDIVDVVNAEGLPGFEGHQSPNNVDWEFRTPVTHWIGAKFEDGKAYFRGLVDKAATDLKRWIRGGTVRTVSIWGFPKLAYENGETKVIGYEPLSIDWTPPRRAGMPTRIVAMGEMDSILDGEMDGSYEDLSEMLSAAAAKKLGIRGSADGYCYVERTYDSYVIVVVSRNNAERKLYKLDYAVDGDAVVLGEPIEVELKRTYEPVEPVSDRTSGETDSGGGKMTWKELVGQLKTMLASKEVTLGQVIGEMELTPEAVAGEMDEVKAAMNAAKTLAEVSEALGVSGEMDVVEVAKAAAQAVEAQKTAAQQAMVDEVLGEKVKGEMAQGLVRRMLQVPENATKEQVAGEIDKLLADEAVKGALSKLHIDQPVIRGLGGGDDGPKNLRVKRQQI